MSIFTLIFKMDLGFKLGDINAYKDKLITNYEKALTKCFKCI